MFLSSGARVGAYEVISLLGAGGMGEVYRARDSRLGRDVALKILPEAFASDADRLARFDHEARTLASLNHPNVGGIHGLEESNGLIALVMELVDGEDLCQRISRGAIPVDEALPVARQILEALEAAHEHGVIHRDLKPANIKVRSDGTVKVLDFGLAKQIPPPTAGERAASRMSHSPTILSPAVTAAGMIIGTAAYMSPEQAKGRSADRRSDMWSFGCVLFEMLSGKPAFGGEDVADTIANVLRGEPDWSLLPASLPPVVRTLLHRCLTKERRARLDSAAAARLDVESAIASPGSGSARAIGAVASRPVFLAAGVAFAALLVAAIAIWWSQPRDSEALPLPARLAIVTPPGRSPWRGPFDRSIAISSDGRHVVYTFASSAGVGAPMMLRSLDRVEVTPVVGVARARAPFFSPDSQWIGFFQDTAIRKAPIAGGTSVLVCNVNGAPRGASWGDDGAIVFATSDPTTGLWRVPAGGGEAAPLTTPATDGRDHLFPFTLPGGRGVLFTIAAATGRADDSEIAVFDATTNQQRTLVRGGTQAEYVPTGHLIYASGGTLRVVRFDLASLQVLSDAVPLPEQVRTAPTGAASYAVSHDGTLVYLPGGPGTEPVRAPVWIDREGREEPLPVPSRSYFMARISPDGTRVAFDIRDDENDIWILDLVRGGALRRLTRGPSLETNPVWTADGKQLIFTSTRSGAPRLYIQAVDGTGSPQELPEYGAAQFATSVVPDGRSVVGHRDGPTSFDVVLFPVDADARGGVPSIAFRELVSTPFVEHNAELSPNGRYISYQSSESGRFEVIVRPFPDVNRGTWTVSAGGTRPVWARTGKELFYRDETGAAVVVPVDTTGPTFSWGTAVKLFDSGDASSSPDRNYDVAPDGRRLLILKDLANRTSDQVVVVLNWFTELKRIAPR